MPKAVPVILAFIMSHLLDPVTTSLSAETTCLLLTYNIHGPGTASMYLSVYRAVPTYPAVVTGTTYIAPPPRYLPPFAPSSKLPCALCPYQGISDANGASDRRSPHWKWARNLNVSKQHAQPPITAFVTPQRTSRRELFRGAKGAGNSTITNETAHAICVIWNSHTRTCSTPGAA